MIMLCKHCMDILGYDEVYTNRIINQECDHCKKGLRSDDVIFSDDLMVELLIKLNKDLGIKTYYSCIGHYVNGINTPTYIIMDKNEVSKFIFDDIITLNGTRGKIRKQSRDRMKVYFYTKETDNIVESVKLKAELVSKISNHIEEIIKRPSFSAIYK